MATVTRPATPLPDPGDDMDAEQVRDWMNNVISFLEGTNIDEANVDLTGSDGIVGKSTAQTIAGQKTFSGGVIGTTIDATTDFTIGSTVITDDSIVMTPSASDTITIAGATNGALSITTVDAAAAAANIQITADGTAELAGTTVTLDSGGGITLDADSGTITFADGGVSLGAITSSGYSGTAALATTVTITDNESTNEDNALIFTAGGDVDGGNLGLESDGTLTYNPSTGKVTATGFIGTLTGTASLATTVTITDNESTNENNAIIFTAGGDLDGGDLGLESDGTLHYNPSTGTVTATIFKGNIDAVDGDFDGTLEADAITLGGTALGSLYSPIAGSSSIVTVGTIGTGTWQGTAIAASYVATLNQNTTGTAALATTVTITDNESTNETNAIVFTAGGDVDGGDLGLESDGNLTYNPSSGLLSSTAVTATGVVTAGGVTLADSAPITMGTGSDATLQFNATNTVLATAGALILQTSGTTEALRIDTSGNVGIGSTNPGQNLVIEDTNASSAITLRFKRTNSTTASGIIDFVGSGDAVGYSIGYNQVWSGTGQGFEFNENGDTTRMFIKDGGAVFIGETANANMTIGLTINQAANDDEILAFKSSAVDHGGTGITDTNTWGAFGKSSAAGGGLRIRGMSDAAGVTTGNTTLYFQSIPEDTALDTAKSTSAQSGIMFDAYVGDGGTSVGTPGTNENIMVIRSGSTTRFIFDAEGSGHADVEWVAFDDYDDIQMVRDVEAMMVPEVFGEAVKYREDDLVKYGLFGKDSIRMEPNGKMRGMMNTTRMTMLHHGTLKKLADRMETLQLQLNEANDKLALLEMN